MAAVAAAVLLGAAATPGSAQAPGYDPASSARLQGQVQRLAAIIRGKLPESRASGADGAARQFLQRLQDASPLAAEKLLGNQMDDEELNSRVDVFLREHPEWSGAAAAPSEPPRVRVAHALRDELGDGVSEAQRLEAADRFLSHLQALSGQAHDSLIAGTMADEELASRVKVFAADERAQASVKVTDPEVEAAAPVVEAFLNANFGHVNERPDSICYRGSIEEKGKKRDFIIFKKRPSKIRIHVIEGGEVVGVIAYDGTSVWRQSRGQPAIPVVGSDADAVIQSSRFDHPLVDYQERGTEVRLKGPVGGPGPLTLRIRERDGTEMESLLDPKTYRELALRTRREGDVWAETRYSDHRRVGPLYLPFVQEEWHDGALRSSTRISEVSLSPGLVDRFFTLPSETSFGFMEYMAALAVIDKRDAKPARAGGGKGDKP